MHNGHRINYDKRIASDRLMDADPLSGNCNYNRNRNEHYSDTPFRHV
jgi:hypothetical protein